MAATSKHSRTLTVFVAALLAALASLIVAAPHALATPGAQLWVSRYNGPGNGNESARSLAVSPDGSKVFVTGQRRPPVGSPGFGDFATVAYDASTGAPLWARRYNGAANRDDISATLAVSPDGTKVFVTGSSIGSTTGSDYATVAYNASTGAQLWVRRFNGPASGGDLASAVGVSTDGSKVFVTGSSKWSTDPRFGDDYATVAYDAASGARLWVKRYNGPARGGDYSLDLRTSPDGSRLFVTGYSDGLTNSTITIDYATVAYQAANGAQLWVKRYDGPARGDDLGSALGVSPGGGRVFVTGRSHGSSASGSDYATVAYKASTGAPLWVRRYNGPASGGDSARALGISPNGSKVFVTGSSQGSTGYGSNDYATVAYNVSTGALRWVRRYNGPGNDDDLAGALGVSPDGSQVFVTGYSFGSTSSFDYATLAYNASTGAALWLRRYDGPANRDDFANALGVSTDGSKLFVTGGSPGSTSGVDFATLAYSIP